MSRTTTHEISEHSLDSISCTSDYERQSLDFERHSSEEELSTIHKGIPSEKRKWSHAHSASCDSTGSVDEEVKELMLEPQPVLFSSSPPKDITVDCISLNQNNEQICDETIQFIVGPESRKSNFRSENRCALVITKDTRTHKANTSESKLTYPKGTVPMLISPRKRHRKVSVSDNKNESSSSMRRPSLDFEKMQVGNHVHYFQHFNIPNDSNLKSDELQQIRTFRNICSDTFLIFVVDQKIILFKRVKRRKKQLDDPNCHRIHRLNNGPERR